MDQDTQKTMSDDQELAKVLAGVSQAADDNLNFEETNPAPAIPTPVEPTAINTAPVVEDTTPVIDVPAPIASAADPALDSIKQAALNELRPLVDKLDVSPEGISSSVVVTGSWMTAASSSNIFSCMAYILGQSLMLGP